MLGTINITFAANMSSYSLVSGYLIKVKNLHSINESKTAFGFGESCLNPVSLAM